MNSSHIVHSRSPFVRWALAVTAVLAVAGCGGSTAKLTAEQERRFASEGIVRRADDIVFRYTHDPGGRGERWEDRKASIVLTKSSLLIHKNQKVGLESTPRTERAVVVQRSGDRVRIRAGSGKSEEVWSFSPGEDAAGWTTDIRNLIKGSKSGAER